MKKILTIFALASLLAGPLQAQSSSFTLGKWVEVNNAILKELSRSYVDSLELGRIERAGVDAMLSALDPYTVYVPEEEQETFQMMLSNTYGGIGAVIHKPDVDGNVIINEPYADSPSAKAGLRCGDEILSIDGLSTHGLKTQEATEKMRGKPGTTVKFQVKKLRGGPSWKAGDVIEVPVVRERIVLPSVEFVGMVEDTTGYILASKFTDGVAQSVKDAVIGLKKNGARRICLDLRGNGGGLLSEAVEMVSLFVPRGSVVVTAKGRAAASAR